MRKEFKAATTIVTIALALSGCATNPDSAASLAADASQSELVIQINKVKQSLDEADKTLIEAKEMELDWFAADEFEEATTALKEAKEYYAEYEFDPSEASDSTGFFSSQTKLEATKVSITNFYTHIDSAKAIRTNAMTTLSEAFDYRAQLKKIDAAKYFPGTSKELESELKKLVDYIADDKAERTISAQPALVAKQRALEVKTVTTIYLSDAQKELERLKSEKINQFAPRSLSEASAALTDATAFIATRPRATEEIIAKANRVSFYLRRAEHIASAVKELRALQPEDHEKYILSYEQIILDIGQALGAEDMRDKAFDKQGQDLVAFIKEAQQGQEDSTQTIQALRKKLKDQDAYVELLKEKILDLTSQLTKAQAELAEKAALTTTKDAAASSNVSTSNEEAATSSKEATSQNETGDNSTASESQ